MDIIFLRQPTALFSLFCPNHTRVEALLRTFQGHLSSFQFCVLELKKNAFFPTVTPVEGGKGGIAIGW